MVRPEAGHIDEVMERAEASATPALERAVFEPLTVEPTCNRPTDRRAVLGRLERALLPPALVVALSGRAVVAVLLEWPNSEEDGRSVSARCNW